MYGFFNSLDLVAIFHILIPPKALFYANKIIGTYYNKLNEWDELIRRIIDTYIDHTVDL